MDVKIDTKPYFALLLAMQRKYRTKYYTLTTCLGLLIALCGIHGTGHAQDSVFTRHADSSFLQQKDSLLQQNSIQTKKRISLKPAGDFDQRFSFIESQGVSIWGYRVGLLINEKFKAGIGGYFLEQLTAGIKVDKQGIPFNQLQKKLYFGTIYYEPFLFRRKRWEMSMVFELGYGKAVLDSTNKIRGRFLTKTEKQDFVPAGMGFSANLIMPDIKGLHFLTYLGLNCMIGLRKTVFESNLKYNYDGWYWSIGSAVFIDKIFTDIFKKGNSK